MLKKIILKMLFLGSLFVFIDFKTAFADEVTVYCADINKNWRWLSGGNVKIKGEWKIRIIDPIAYAYYFEADEGAQKVVELFSQCKKEFGEDFIYAQPFSKKHSSWHRFGISYNQIFIGHESISIY